MYVYIDIIHTELGSIPTTATSFLHVQVQGYMLYRAGSSVQVLLVTIVLLCSRMITAIIKIIWTSTAILKHLMVQSIFDSQTMQEGITATTIV